MILITQLDRVTSLSYICSNFLSLFTCLPLAIAVLALGKGLLFLFNNKYLYSIGNISYEIYLVQSFSLNVIKNDWVSIIKFVLLTILLSLLIHFILKGSRNGRFNSSYSYKK